ncbi:MAG TPA: DUF2721 domain-containing protein [Kiloniellales bacterium]|nr:DUF2721 domain-containing protein [Kiloniellales bacterium]
MGADLVPDIEKLEHIFSNAIAPAFFLGAVAAFVSLMTSRLADVNGRIKTTIAQADGKPPSAGGSVTLELLLRRARLLADGIVLSLAGGVCATLLLAVLFLSQIAGFSHAYGAALLFTAAILLLGLALFRFAQEASHARNELKETQSRLAELQAAALGSEAAHKG